jgi:hypothetical protein
MVFVVADIEKRRLALRREKTATLPSEVSSSRKSI